MVPVHSVGPDGLTCSCPKGANCTAAGKHPIGTDWQDQSGGVESIRALLEKRSRVNLGVLVKPSGVVVIDIDPRNGGDVTMKTLVGEQGALPPTKVIATGGGGWHYYFEAPDGVALRGTLGQGIDLKSSGMVVAEGSRSSTGSYSVLTDLPIAPLPEWVVREAARPISATTPVEITTPVGGPTDDGPASRQRRYLSAALTAETARLDALREAQTVRLEEYRGEPWDATVYAVACNLTEIANTPESGLTGSDVARLVLEHAPTDGGFTEADIEAKVESARRTVGAAQRGVPAPHVDPFGMVVGGPAVVSGDAETDNARPASDDGKKSAATRLTGLARDRYTFAHTPAGEPFAVPISGAKVVRLLRGSSASLRAELAATYLDIFGSPPTSQALADAILALEGIALQGESVDLALRVGMCDGALWIDLGDETGEVIRVDPSGWSVVAGSPVLHRRTALTAPMVRPSASPNLAALWTLLNVVEADRAVLLAVLVASLMPDMPHPILSLSGEQGTGKSTAARILVSIVDPSTVPLRKPPRDLESWTTAAMGSHVVAVDNISTITDWFSDALCRAATGDGDVRRKLYADADLHVFSFRRVVILNGIDLGTVRDDLTDRLVTVELQRIPDSARLAEGDLDEAWREALPAIVAGLLDLASRVLAVLPETRLDRQPRMADFARVLAAVDRVIGTDGLDRYGRQAVNLAADAVRGDPVLAVVTEAITAPWEGPLGDLLDLLNARRDPFERRPQEWPSSARELTTLLRRRAPSLRRIGWSVEKAARRSKRGEVWLISPPKGGDETGDETVTRFAAEISSPISSPSRHPLQPSTGAETGQRVTKVTKNAPPLLCWQEGGREGGEPGDPAIGDGPEISSLSSPRHPTPGIHPPTGRPDGPREDASAEVGGR